MNSPRRHIREERWASMCEACARLRTLDRERFDLLTAFPDLAAGNCGPQRGRRLVPRPTTAVRTKSLTHVVPRTDRLTPRRRYIRLP
jgi:hypothetical protein